MKWFFASVSGYKKKSSPPANRDKKYINDFCNLHTSRMIITINGSGYGTPSHSFIQCHHLIFFFFSSSSFSFKIKWIIILLTGFQNWFELGYFFQFLLLHVTENWQVSSANIYLTIHFIFFLIFFLLLLLFLILHIRFTFHKQSLK